ncbi:SDR family NAD(P)-dependent oxidoreductase OS=Streptomyces alboniger OX=132473 GN=CP975_27350 PE=4 SV=1 [Streptomyces alboniger]
MTSLTPERLDTVLRPKLDAALNLADLTARHPLSDFVLFSSAAATFGSPGQGNYAAANAFLDAFAHRLRAAGVPATAMAWGLWAERSELTGALDEADLTRISRGGVLPLASRRASRCSTRPAARASPCCCRYASTSRSSVPAVARACRR